MTENDLGSRCEGLEKKVQTFGERFYRTALKLDAEDNPAWLIDRDWRRISNNDCYDNTPLGFLVAGTALVGVDFEDWDLVEMFWEWKVMIDRLVACKRGNT